jgi:hypothetical protein
VGGIVQHLVNWGQMSCHQERLAAIAAAKANLIDELSELNILRDRFREAQSRGNNPRVDVEIAGGRRSIGRPALSDAFRKRQK